MQQSNHYPAILTIFSMLFIKCHTCDLKVSAMSTAECVALRKESSELPNEAC